MGQPRRKQPQQQPEQAAPETGSGAAAAAAAAALAAVATGGAAAAPSLAAAAASAAALQALGKTAAAVVPSGAPPAAAVAAATGTLLDAMDRLFRSRRKTLMQVLTDQAANEMPGAPLDRVQTLARQEMNYEVEFQRKVRARLERELPEALKLPDDGSRARKVGQILEREKRYLQQREQAAAARLVGALEMDLIRNSSPQGAYWQLSPLIIEHCPKCLAMANKFWPWEVLDLPGMHLPIHPNCGCRLLTLDEAVSQGLMTEDQIPDTEDAIRRARRWIQEAERLERVLSPQVLEAAITESYEAAIQEASNRQQLRFTKGFEEGGQFRSRGGGNPGKRILGKVKHDLDSLRALVQQESPAKQRSSGRSKRVQLLGTEHKVPVADAWQHSEGGVHYQSPPGGSNIYRDGILMPHDHPDFAPDAKAPRPLPNAGMPAGDRHHQAGEPARPPVQGIPDYTGQKLTIGKSAGGSNGAVWGTDEDGDKWLVKTYRGDQDRIATELLANAIYREMGAAVPEAGTWGAPGIPAFDQIPDTAIEREPKLPKPKPPKKGTPVTASIPAEGDWNDTSSGEWTYSRSGDFTIQQHGKDKPATVFYRNKPFGSYDTVAAAKDAAESGEGNATHSGHGPTPRQSTGIIVREPDGRIWVYEPKGHYGGYENTFPKGGLEKGLTPQQNAHKELWEETGIHARIVDWVGDYEGDTGMTRYYLAVRTGGEPLPDDPTPYDGGNETARVRLLKPDEVEAALNRPRDKQVLKDALELEYPTDPGPDDFPPAKDVPALTYQALPGDMQRIAGPNKALGEHFMTDALLANWDFIGLGHDNVLWQGEKPIRLDQGGTLQYRARGQQKPFGAVPTEVWTMLSPKGGQGYGTVDVSEGSMRDQAREIGRRLTPARIDALVDQAPFQNIEMREEVRQALKDRVDWMARYADGDEDLPQPIEGNTARAAMTDWQKDLEPYPEQHAALAGFMTDDHLRQDVQEFLKTAKKGDKAPDDVWNTVRELDSLLRVTRTDDDMTVYLPWPSGHDADKMAGQTMRSTGYLGAVTSRGDTRAMDEVLELMVPSGSRALYTTQVEGIAEELSAAGGETPGLEVLLPRGQRIKIVGTEKRGTGYVVKGLLVP